MISDHFYYFGDKPIELPDDLKPIIHHTQGHKSVANKPYVETFIAWISKSGRKVNGLYGEPQLKREFSLDPSIGIKCASRCLASAEKDEREHCARKGCG